MTTQVLVVVFAYITVQNAISANGLVLDLVEQMSD